MGTSTVEVLGYTTTLLDPPVDLVKEVARRCAAGTRSVTVGGGV